MPTTRSQAAASAEGSSAPDNHHIATVLREAAATRSRNTRQRRSTIAQEPFSITRPVRETRSSMINPQESINQESSSLSTNKATLQEDDDKAVQRPTKSGVSKCSTPKARNIKNIKIPKPGLKISTRTMNLRGSADVSPRSPDINTSSADSTTTTTQTQGNSPFLRLPAELRNSIYKMALVSPTPLTINGPDPQQPGLTRTCKQIRLESLRIFYTQNKFSCVIQNYDPSTFKQYRKVADQYGLSTVVLTHRHAPDVTRAVLRKNLLEWLMGTFAGETAPLGYSAGYTEDTFKWEKLSHRIVKVFNLAKEMRKAKVSKETAMAVFENAVDSAGVCGEKPK